MAVNCWLVPNAIEMLAGVTDRPTRGGGVTCKVAVPEIVPDMAVMLADPCPVLVANPPLLMVATSPEEVAQVAELVKVCVVPLL